MKYSIKYKNAYAKLMLDIEDDDVYIIGCSNFQYKGYSVTVLCEGQSLYAAIKDFVEMTDETIDTIDNEEEI